MKTLHLLVMGAAIATGLLGLNTAYARCTIDEPNCEPPGAATLFPKPIASQGAHFIVNSTTQCLPQDVEYYKQVYNSTMNHINDYFTVNLLHVQNQSVGNVNRELFSLAKNRTFDETNLASYCLGMENVNRTLLVQPLPDTVKILTYNITAMRQYLPVLVDDYYYLQQYREVSKEIDQIIARNSSLEEQISNLKDANGPVGDKIQELKLQIAADNETRQSLVNKMDFIQNQSRAMFTLDPPTKEKLDNAVASLSSMYMMGVPPKNAENHPVQEIFANYEYKNIYIDFDPDKTINNPDGDRSQQIISDIKKITGDIPLNMVYDKIVPIGGNGNNHIAENLGMPPLKQFQSGTTIQNITCKEGFVLTIKKQGHQPACVSPDTIPKLVLRGWSENPLNELLLKYTNQTKANLIFYDIMNEQQVRNWSQTGWKYNSYDTASDGEKQTASATVHLYLPANEKNHPECKNGSQAFVVVNLKPKPVEIDSNMTVLGCIPDYNGGGDPELNRK